MDDWRIDWDWSAPDDPAWRKVEKWGGRFKYKREYGGRVGLTEAQGKRLDGILVNATEAQRQMAAALAGNEPGKPWRNKPVEDVMVMLRSAMVGFGFRDGTTEFVSVDRAAARAAHRCRARHKRVLDPGVYEENPTFRVCAGLAHNAPIEIIADGDSYGRVLLGDLGWVQCGDKINEAWSSAAYAEMVRMVGSWRVRFTWCDRSE